MKIEDLGLSKEQLTDLVVNQAVEGLLYRRTFDEMGDDVEVSTDLSRRIEKMIKERIDSKVEEIGDKHVAPVIGNAIESLVLQKTTSWGEKKGEPLSFIEYLVQRADHYMQEPVNSSGKTKNNDSYNWRANGTRIEFMIDKHLQYHISVAMEKALKDVNSSIAGGIEKAIKIQLEKVLKSVKLSVKT
jgi:hypothetical protein